MNKSNREISVSDVYDNPLIGRYASAEMAALWGPRRKFSTWRRLWVALAEAEAELDVEISKKQIEQLRAHVDDVDFDKAAEYEHRLRHDVMAHVHAYGDACPDAAGIIHLGATSCFVTDTTELILIRDGLHLLEAKLLRVIESLADFAAGHRDVACLGFTHLQPAQPTTVGKRACLWAYDLVQDLGELEFHRARLKARGAKGTTGTQASFLQLFGGDHAKVRRLDQIIAEKMGFEASYPVTGQTYPRKVDARTLDVLAGIAASAHKAATDLRLLQSRKEIEEPFEAEQIGSSAMAYKRNPMRAERICSLARFVLSLASSTSATAATQWLERTLDDSANRRLVIPQAFLAVDAILSLYCNVAAGLVVYPNMIARHLNDELPFMATEAILMEAVAAGGDRQQLHERIRRHSQAAAAVVKEQGRKNDLIERLTEDKAFASVDLAAALAPAKFVGRAPQQVDEFLTDVIGPLRVRFPKQATDAGDDVRV